MVISIKEYGKSLGTREIGKQIRNIIVNDEERTVLDFSDVFIVSNSFSDEIFGALVAQKGYPYLVNKIKLQNTNDEVARVIKNAIIDRMKK